MEDLRFISNLKKSGGKLMFVQESGEERDLTDEEKMRAAEILITIVMTLMKTFMKDMTEQ
jgi:hypothetical protein